MKVSSILFHNDKWSAPLDSKMDSEQTLIVVFASPSMRESSGIAELRNKFPKSTIVGCSTSGEIFGSEVFDDSLSVGFLKFEKSHLKRISVPIGGDTSEVSARSFKVGHQIASELKLQSTPGAELRYLLVLSDGLKVNGTDLTGGLNSVLKGSVPVSGGLAGDGSNFKSTFVIDGGSVLEGQVVAIGIYSDALTVGTGSFGGWDAFGPVRKITKSSGNVLFELDGKPALQLYREYLGAEAANLPASALLFPIEIRLPNRNNLVRTILGIDDAAGSLTFAGDMPEGAEVQLMKANFAQLIDGASRASKDAIDLLPNKLKSSAPAAAIGISCVGRRLVLKSRIEDETEAVQSNLRSDGIFVGFYSYGEISTGRAHGCDLHNQTMTITVLQEVE